MGEAMEPALVDWIAVDWGTSNLRAWAMSADDRPLAETSSQAGTSNLARDEFEPALLDVIVGWLDLTRVTDVVACGMVGARQNQRRAVLQRCLPSRHPDIARHNKGVFRKAAFQFDAVFCVFQNFDIHV